MTTISSGMSDSAFRFQLSWSSIFSRSCQTWRR